MLLWHTPQRPWPGTTHAKIEGMAASVGARSAVFDGDTPPGRRQRILDSPPHILVTNFDVINYHLPRPHRVRGAPAHRSHTGHGRGAHLHGHIREQRAPHTAAGWAGCAGRLQVVAASATVSEPARFCSHLLDRDIRVVRPTGGGAASTW